MDLVGLSVLLFVSQALAGVSRVVERPALDVYGVLNCKMSMLGKSYSYPLRETHTGKTCQRWDSQSPHEHTVTDPTLFPEGNLSDAENFCRNPTKEYGPWCYTTDPDTRWEFCAVNWCPVQVFEFAWACRFTQIGAEYRGSQSETASGRTCQRWASQHPHEHDDRNLVFLTLYNISDNYCRNPSGDAGGPWCYTTDREVRWEYCTVPYCKQGLWDMLVESINNPAPTQSTTTGESSTYSTSPTTFTPESNTTFTAPSTTSTPRSTTTPASCWIVKPNTALYGHNDHTVNGESLASCKRLCQSYTDFQCLSLDITEDGLCALSRDSAQTQPDMLGAHGTSTYAELIPDCKEGNNDLDAGLECPDGWSYNSQNEHCYWFELSFGTHKRRSELACQERGSYLVQIQDRDEMEFLASISRDLSDHGREIYWTGAYITNGTWFWNTLSAPDGDWVPVELTQDFWEPGEPNNFIGEEDDAVLAVHLDGRVGMNDIVWHEYMQYICEKPRTWFGPDM